MQPENQDVRPPDPDSRWERYSLAKLHTRGECGREVFFEKGDAGQNLSEITKNVSDAQRVYDPEGIGKTLKGLGGGMGAKTGLYAVTRGRSTQPWKESEVAPSRRIGDKDDIRVITGSPSYKEGKREMSYKTSEDAPTIRATQYKSGDNQPKVMVPEATKQGYAVAEEGDSIDCGMQQHTLVAPNGKKIDLENARIRRLTPTECMRLMSWPDDHCDYGIINGEKVEISDTQKYKMAGNGVVSKVIENLISKIINK